jgi:ATP-binding cassette, subfamily B, bacterial CylB
MRKIRFVQQAEHSECGLASIVMLMQYYGSSTNLMNLRNHYGVPRGGYKVAELVSILKDHQFETKAYKTTASFNELPLPCLAYWNNNHYLVIEKATQKRVLICDPATGRRWISMEEAQNNFSNIIIHVTKAGPQVKAKKEPNFLYHFLKTSFKRPLFALLILTMVLQLFTLMIPMFTRKLIDGSTFLTASFLQLAIGASVLFIVAYYFIQVSRGFIVATFQRKFDHGLMTYYMQKLLKLPISFFVNRSTGELIFRSNLSVYIRQILTQNVVLLVVDSVFLIFYIALMWTYSPILSLVTVSIACTMVVISVLNTKKIKHYVDLEMIEQAKVQKSITETIEGIETIKSTGKEQDFYNSWLQHYSKQLDITNEKERFSATFVTMPQSLQVALPIILLIIGLSLVQQQSMTLGTVVAFLTLASSFITPVMSLSNVYNDFILLQSYFSKIAEIIEHPIREEGKQQLGPFKSLEVKNVSYQYSVFDKPVLQNISLYVERGEKIAIVGESGSGKSTLLKLLSGLIEPTGGNITYNQYSLTDIERQSLHRQVSYTNQHAAIFNDTVKQNIMLNADVETSEVELQHLKDILQKSGVDQIVDSLPLGVDSILSEQGANLSGGQRQKVALARSLYKKPAIHLLDEPTAALDNISERQVMQALLAEEATCIIVAHRLQTIQQVDRIIVMKDGQIIGQGTHNELIHSNTYYRQLYMQEQLMEDAG